MTTPIASGTPRRSSSALLAACALAMALAGCASQSEKIGQRATPAEVVLKSDADATPIARAQLRYELQVGDVVDVKFYYHPELNEQFVIPPDNRVSMQLIGEVDTTGLSTRALQAQLYDRYRKELRQPDITVILRKYASPKIFVSGEVARPGSQALETGGLTALQAIIQSGGFKPGAERTNIVVLRNSGSGQPTFIKLDMQAHLEQNTVADLPLKPYDVVFVPQRRIAEVAEFFDEYVNKIVPIYRNMGFYFSYDVNPKDVKVNTSTPTN